MWSSQGASHAQFPTTSSRKKKKKTSPSPADTSNAAAAPETGMEWNGNAFGVSVEMSGEECRADGCRH